MADPTPNLGLVLPDDGGSGDTWGLELNAVLTQIDAAWGTLGTLAFENGAGDVTGPATAISGNLLIFADTTGKMLADAGVAPGNFALAGHDHDAAYSPLGHNHDAAYSPLGHNHDAAYAALSHDHDAAYSPLGHDHDARYLQLVGGAMAGAIAMSSQKITGLAAGTAAGDALRYEQVIGASADRGAIATRTSVAQSIPNNTVTTLTFQTERKDTDNIFDIGTSASSMTVPSDARRVRLKGRVAFAANSTGVRLIEIFKAGTQLPAADGLRPRVVLPPASAEDSTIVEVSTQILSTTGGEVFTLVALQSSGGSLNVTESMLELEIVR